MVDRGRGQNHGVSDVDTVFGAGLPSMFLADSDHGDEDDLLGGWSGPGADFDPERETAQCPLDARCAGCHATDDLRVMMSMFGDGQIACATVCRACEGRSILHLPDVGLAGVDARITAHRKHRG